MNLDWIAGFVEGEGCFTWLGKWNNTTREGKRVYYRRRQPQFLIAQNGREALDEIAMTLAEHGITVRVWRKHLDRPEGRGGYAYELRVVGYENCQKVGELLRGRMHVPYKMETMEKWLREIMEVRERGPVADEEIMGSMPERCQSYA